MRERGEVIESAGRLGSKSSKNRPVGLSWGWFGKGKDGAGGAKRILREGGTRGGEIGVAGIKVKVQGGISRKGRWKKKAGGLGF